MSDLTYRRGFGKDLIEPKRWPYVPGDTRREPVLDPNHSPPRVIRKVGYRRCMSCRKFYFSEDCVKLRMCPVCKQTKDCD